MRNVSEELLAHFQSGATTLCRCWKVERADGVVMGFTDHDADLIVDGHAFEASTGFDASALQNSAGLSVDNSEAVGALSAVGVTEEDIVRGKYDGAAITQLLVNWNDTSQNLVIFRGSLGEVTRGDGSFEVELRGLAEALNSPMGRSYLRQCDRRLGDAKCGVDTSDPLFTGSGTVDHVSSTQTIYISGLDQFEDGWFAQGQVIWQSGANADTKGAIHSDVLEDGLRVLELWLPPQANVAEGDLVQLIAGCDKLALTCRTKFANFMNFRGFPHMPGEDWVTAYPVTANANDGGSIVPYE